MAAWDDDGKPPFRTPVRSAFDAYWPVALIVALILIVIVADFRV